MLPKRDLAITLRSVPFEERHRIVTALTLENGLVSALAKNSIQSRRFGGSLDLFSAAEWLFTIKPGAELYHLSEAHIREPFEKLRSDFTLLSVACALTELMLKIAPSNEACPELFRLHSNALAALNDMDISLLASGCGHEIAFLNAYLGKLLQWNGNQPRLHQCLQCQIPLDQMSPHMELSCVIPSAGWICPACRLQSTHHIHNSDGYSLQQSSLRLTPLTIQDLQLSLCIPIRQIFSQVRASRQNHRDLFKFLEALFVYHIPGFDRKALKSLRFLELESKLPPVAKSLQ